jgi:hypothetical protein
MELLMFHFEAGMSRKRTEELFNANHTMKFLFKSKIKTQAYREAERRLLICS